MCRLKVDHLGTLRLRDWRPQIRNQESGCGDASAKRFALKLALVDLHVAALGWLVHAYLLEGRPLAGERHDEEGRHPPHEGPLVGQARARTTVDPAIGGLAFGLAGLARRPRGAAARRRRSARCRAPRAPRRQARRPSRASRPRRAASADTARCPAGVLQSCGRCPRSGG